MRHIQLVVCLIRMHTLVHTYTTTHTVTHQLGDDAVRQLVYTLLANLNLIVSATSSSAYNFNVRIDEKRLPNCLKPIVPSMIEDMKDILRNDLENITITVQFYSPANAFNRTIRRA